MSTKYPKRSRSWEWLKMMKASSVLLGFEDAQGLEKKGWGTLK